MDTSVTSNSSHLCNKDILNTNLCLFEVCNVLWTSRFTTGNLVIMRLIPRVQEGIFSFEGWWGIAVCLFVVCLEKGLHCVFLTGENFLRLPMEGDDRHAPTRPTWIMHIERTSNLIALILHIRDHAQGTNMQGHLLLVTDGGVFKQQMPALFPESVSQLHCLPQTIRTVQEVPLMPGDFRRSWGDPTTMSQGHGGRH